jgi:hypothetical protein
MAMPLEGAKTARQLRDEVYAITRGVPMRWISVHELGLRHADLSEQALDQAVAVAISKGWMLGEGTPPHSACLTEARRRVGKG